MFELERGTAEPGALGATSPEHGFDSLVVQSRTGTGDWPGVSARMCKERCSLAVIFVATALFIAALSPVSLASTGRSSGPSHSAPRSQAGILSGWSGTLHTFSTPHNSGFPTVVSGSDGAHVVWEEEGTLYHSYGHGADWTEPASVAVGDSHAMAVDGNGRPHLVWANETGNTFRIYHSRWNGESWELPQTVFETTLGQSGAPDIAVSVGAGGEIHVVWENYYEGQSRIYIHGEKEFETEEERRQNGIPLHPKVMETLRGLSEEFGVPLEGSKN